MAKIFCFFVPAKEKWTFHASLQEQYGVGASYQQYAIAAIFAGHALFSWNKNFNGNLMGKKQYKTQGIKKPRTKKAVFLLGDEEYNLIHFYLKKYKISNRSRWFRETVLNHVLKNMEQDYPTLFEENEMRR